MVINDVAGPHELPWPRHVLRTKMLLTPFVPPVRRFVEREAKATNWPVVLEEGPAFAGVRDPVEQVVPHTPRFAEEPSAA